MISQIVNELDPQQLGQIIAKILSPDEYLRRGINEPRNPGEAGAVRPATAQRGTGAYAPIGPPRR